MKKFLLGLIIGGAIVFCYFFTKENPDNNYVIKVNNLINKILNKNTEVGIANPASTYCVENNGNLEIQSGGSIGICKFKDGSACEERAFFRGECSPEASKNPTTNTGNTNTNDPITNTGDEEPTICTMEYAPVCAKVEIQCIKAPCDPIEQTFGNKCQMKANKLATFLYDGECKTNQKDCPKYSEPSPDFCKDGKIMDKGLDENGCQLPPECIK